LWFITTLSIQNRAPKQAVFRTATASEYRGRWKRGKSR
jgi:hypothetical protein